MAVPHFEFTEPFGDARVEELKLLSWTAQHGELSFASVPTGAWHDLLLSLVSSELLTVFAFEWAQTTFSRLPNQTPDLASSSGIVGESGLERAIVSARVRAVFDLYQMRPPAALRLTHWGRVRLSELKQALRAGREREPFGILWDVRHWEQDVQIAILEAREGSPLALAYLDMNGLKQINDTHDHDAGDLALRTYFQAAASVLGDRGQAYRLSGGADEVLVVLPNHDEQTAVQIVQLACKKLMNERLWPTDPNALLSIAAGVITNTNPSALPGKLRATADEEQKRAKQRSKETTPRPSVIAVNGKDDLIIIEHDAGRSPVKIAGSYFENIRDEKGITFTVTNASKDPVPPFKVGLFHPRLGS
jgi:diguanylate cyclase (GGDEF)-like protein